MLQTSKVFDKNVEAWADDNVRYIINQGGTSSTKTFSVLQLLTMAALKHPLHIDIAGLNVPHLKSGVLNDMPAVCHQLGVNFYNHYHASDRVFKCGEGHINFIAIDKIGKAHGGRRDILFLNEANHLAFPIAEQLMIRTRKKVLIDFNPTGAFWVHKKILVEEPENSRLIKSTYLDNPFLEAAIVKSIESKRGDGNNNFWRVYGLGDLGIAEGLVLTNFEQFDFDIERFADYHNGIDWGFSNDPFAFVRLAIENEYLYICREIYQRGLLNKDSAPMVKKIIDDEIVRCDSAEPKSVREYNTLGVNARSAVKGKGSVKSGIKFLQSFKKIYVHPSCSNYYNECCNLQWKLDRNGEETTEFVPGFDHLIDASRYALEDKIRFARKSRALDF